MFTWYWKKWVKITLNRKRVFWTASQRPNSHCITPKSMAYFQGLFLMLLKTNKRGTWTQLSVFVRCDLIWKKSMGHLQRLKSRQACPTTLTHWNQRCMLKTLNICTSSSTNYFKKKLELNPQKFALIIFAINSKLKKKLENSTFHP